MTAHPHNRALNPNFLSIECGVCTHIGRRPQNQDKTLTVCKAWGRLFAVADGMGGHPGGELASQLACEYLKEFFTNKRIVDKKKPYSYRNRLVDAIIRVDRYIRLHGRRHKAMTDMGTTLSCLLIDGTHSIIAHVGDSRIYRHRNGRLSQLTTDHTFVQDMIFEGEVDPSQAYRHPLRHLLTRVVGTEEVLEFVDSRIDDIKLGDQFLLCTDGLTGSLNEDSIIEAMKEQSTAADTAARLVKTALRNGARDNITAIVVTC